MKILLTGDFFHDYQYDLKEGLEQNGHQVDMRFNNIHGPYHPFDTKTSLKWLQYGFLPVKAGIPFFRDKAISEYNADLLSMMKRTSFDIMMVIGAKTIFPETIQAFKGRKVFYFMDALPRYEFVIPRIPLFDDLFVFEPTDRAIIQEKIGRTAHFLTLAFSPSRYFKIHGMSESFDFSFVGTRYPKREEYLDALMDISDNLRIYGDFYKTAYPRVRSHTKKVNVLYPVANELYNQSKVNINIHHPQSKEGLAIRTFEIIGAGGFQLVERQKAAIEFFEEGVHMAFYDSKEEFLDKAAYYLRNDSERLRIAANCHKLALEKHTWKYRMKEMFEHLG